MMRFVQLGGKRRTLELRGHAQPHGKAHKDAIASDAIELRAGEVYVGGQDVPVRQIFGLKHSDLEFKGRFSDYWGGDGFALAKTAEVKKFVAEMQPVRMTWGDTFNVTGLIQKFEPGRESEREVAWQLVLHVDTDELLEITIDIPSQPKQKDYINQILLYSTEVQTAFKSTLPLRGSIFDTLNGLIAGLASATSSLVRIANAFGSIESETIGSVRRLRAALGQVKTAAVSVRDTFDAYSVDFATEAQSWDEQFRYMRGQAIASDSTISLILAADRAEREAAIAEQGRVLQIVEAKGGDTFESMATQAYGSADRANDIRAANDASAGGQPVVGQLYTIPI